MELREWVRVARGFGGMTQHELARALQYTRSGVAGWESGRRQPGFRDQLAVSKVTGYPMPESTSEKWRATSELPDDPRAVNAARWMLAFDDIKELRADLARQILDTLKTLAEEARRSQMLESENAVLRAQYGSPSRPMSR